MGLELGVEVWIARPPPATRGRFQLQTPLARVHPPPHRCAAKERHRRVVVRQ